MNLQLPLSLLFVVLVVLVLLIAVLTASETALLTYKRLHASSRNVHLNQLLARTDHFIILLQLFKYLLIILATLIAANLSLQLLDQAKFWQLPLALSSFALILLLFAELLPRQLARLYPEALADTFANFYAIALSITWPLVVLMNALVNFTLKLCRQPTATRKLAKFSGAELRQLVAIEGANIPPEHLEMLTSIADLESRVVEDIMIPRHQLVGIDLADDWMEVER